MLKLSFNEGQLRLYLGLFLAVFILTASCNPVKTSPSPDGLSATNCNKIAILLPETDPAPRWEASDRPELERRIAQKLINRVDDLTLLYFNADRNQDKQRLQAERALKQEVCLLIIGPVSAEKAAEILPLARQYKVPVIAYDRMIENKSDYAPYYIAFNSKRVGWYQGNYIADQLKLGSKGTYQLEPKNNQYVMINGDPEDSNTKLLAEGFHESLKPFIYQGKIKPIEKPFPEMQYIKDWEKEEAAKVMEQVLKENQNLKIAWIGNDTMAAEIISKFADDKKGKIVITGQDGTQDSLINIQRKWQSMTVCKDIKNIAEKTALLVEALFKEEIEKPIDGLLEDDDYLPVRSYTSGGLYIVREDNFNSIRDKNGKIKLENTCKGKK